MATFDNIDHLIKDKELKHSYLNMMLPLYDEVCKLYGCCVYEYVHLNSKPTFKPELLLGDIDFINMEHLRIADTNYFSYLDKIREHEFYKLQQTIKQQLKAQRFKLSAKPFSGLVYDGNDEQTIPSPYWVPYSFKDRWMRIMKRLAKLKIVEPQTVKVHGFNMTFWSFTKSGITELRKTALLYFI